ncbi:MAG: response regulator transcription factor [Acidiferrobacterales bacterium]|nr:response regulator transcription factor [Acidiferrobacterales bacterium]
MPGSRQDIKKTILIAEDDKNTSNLLKRYFVSEGFETYQADNGDDALNTARLVSPSCIILDLMMPGLPGWDVCERLRSFSRVPILILSARQEEADRILGLNLGADDYVVKPFSPREVVARVRAILRRTEPEGDTEQLVLENGGLSLDLAEHRVSLEGRDLALTTSEFVLIRTLLSRPGRVFSRHEMLDQLYSDGYAVVDRVIDVHIASIRQKLEAVSGDAKLITTVRGVGYRMEVQ